MEIFACLVYLKMATTWWRIDFPCLKGFQETLRNKFQLARFKEILISDIQKKDLYVICKRNLEMRNNGLQMHKLSIEFDHSDELHF